MLWWAFDNKTYQQLFCCKKKFKKYLKYKHTCYFVLDKGNVWKVTQRDFSALICGRVFPKIFPFSNFFLFLIQHEVNIFLKFSICFLHQVPLLAGHCSILLCLEEPCNNIAKADASRTNTVLFHPELLFNISEEKKKITRLGFQFQLPLDSILKLFFTITKTSRSVALCFTAEGTFKHFCDAIHVNS